MRTLLERPDTLDTQAIIEFEVSALVSNVAKLTRSLRNSFLRKDVQPRTSSPHQLAEKRTIVHQELQQTGEAIFVDDHGNRFRIERRPA